MKNPPIIAEWVDQRPRHDVKTYRLSRAANDTCYQLSKRCVDMYDNLYWEVVGSVVFDSVNIESVLVSAIEALAKRMRGLP